MSDVSGNIGRKVPGNIASKVLFGSQFRISTLFNETCALRVFAVGFDFESLKGTLNKCWFNVWLLTMAAMGIRLSLADSEAIKAFVVRTGDQIGMPSDIDWPKAVEDEFKAFGVFPYIYDDSHAAGAPLMDDMPGASKVFFCNWADGGHWVVRLPIDSPLAARFAAFAEHVTASVPAARNTVAESAADRELRMVIESSGVSRAPVSQPASARAPVSQPASADEELLKALAASAADAEELRNVRESSAKTAEECRKLLVALLLQIQELRVEIADTEQRIAQGRAELVKLDEEKDFASICAMTEVLDEHSHRLTNLKSAIAELLVEQAAIRALKASAPAHRSPASQPAHRSPASHPAPRSPASQPAPRSPASQPAPLKASAAEKEAFQAALKASADEAASLAEVARFQAEELARVGQIEWDAALARTWWKNVGSSA